MARPSNSELVKRAARTRAAIAEADPLSTAAMVATKRRLLQRFKTDVDWWYDAAKATVMWPGSKEDEPRVKIILAVLRSYLAEQRVFPVVGTDQASAASPVQVFIGVPQGAELRRGTLAARQEAIEVRARQTGEPGPSGGDHPAV